MKYQTYVTSRGYELKIRSISPFLLDEIKASVPEPPKPTYKTKLVGGGEQEHYHDLTTLETDEDREQWAEYLRAKSAADALRSEKISMVMFEEGIINWDELQPTPEWEAKRRSRGLDIPSDGSERQIKYLETEIFGSMADVFQFQTLLMKAGGDVPEEAIQQIEASFRSLLQRAASGYLANPSGPLESLAAVGNVHHGDGMGENPQPVYKTTPRRPGSDDRNVPYTGEDEGMGRGTPPEGSGSQIQSE
jgi:hypothetical protein